MSGISVRDLETPRTGFDRYWQEMRNRGGNRISRGNSSRGMVYTAGPFKGMTEAQAYEAARKRYAALPGRDKSRYEEGAYGRDVMSERDSERVDAHYQARDTAAGLTPSLQPRSIATEESATMSPQEFAKLAASTGGNPSPSPSPGEEREPSFGSDGGPGFSNRETGATWKGLRTEKEVEARKRNSHVNRARPRDVFGQAARRSARRASPVSSTRTPSPGMTTAQSKQYKARAIAGGFGSAKPPKNSAASVKLDKEPTRHT